MKLLMCAVLVLTLAGCASHDMNHQYNPLGGARVTTITPSSSEQSVTHWLDDNMIVIQAELKKIVNAQGIKNVYLYWTINDAQKKDNMAVYDITITVADLRQRFIFGLTGGVIGMVKEIEPDAEVNCQHEGEQYGERDQA